MPSTVAGGFAAMRLVASVTRGAEAQAVARASEMTANVFTAASIISPMAEEQTHRFEIDAAWSGDGAGEGRVRLGNSVSVPVAGAAVLAGGGTGANPEELLLAA